MDFGQKTMDFGQKTMDFGQKTMDNGQWTIRQWTKDKSIINERLEDKINLVKYGST